MEIDIPTKNQPYELHFNFANFSGGFKNGGKLRESQWARKGDIRKRRGAGRERAHINRLSFIKIMRVPPSHIYLHTYLQFYNISNFTLFISLCYALLFIQRWPMFIYVCVFFIIRTPISERCSCVQNQKYWHYYEHVLKSIILTCVHQIFGVVVCMTECIAIYTHTHPFARSVVTYNVCGPSVSFI